MTARDPSHRRRQPVVDAPATDREAQALPRRASRGSRSFDRTMDHFLGADAARRGRRSEGAAAPEAAPTGRAPPVGVRCPPWTITPPESPRGFSSRAILAATRSPTMAQHSTAVPIYQSATFATDDASRAGGGHGLGQRLHLRAARQPDRHGDGARPSPSSKAPRPASPSARAWRPSTPRWRPRSEAGDRVVATRAVYGSTRQLLDRVFARFGVRTDYVDATDLAAVEAAAARRAAAVRRDHRQPDHGRRGHREPWPSIAHGAGAELIVDNTFASPYLCRPIELGADLVVDSATKWLSGHSDVLAGAVVGSDGTDPRGA